MTTAGERIATLDTIRGVAVMGILTMNIVAFAMPGAAYMNPAAYGSHGALDYAAWALNFIFFDGKMRGLFSFLFGASTLLVVERAEAAGRSGAVTHFSRMVWLFVFGMAHLYFIWSGDILQHYAVIGVIAWFCRRMPLPQMMALGVTLLVFETLMLAQTTWQVHAIELAMRAPRPTANLVQAYQGYRNNFGMPDSGFITRDLAANRGGYAVEFAHRLKEVIAIPLQTFEFVGAETLAYMLFGMAGLRSGMLTGAWPRAAYRRIALIGFGVGIPAYAAMALWVWLKHFDMLAIVLTGLTLSTIVRPVMIAAWASLIALLARPGGALTTRIAAAGRMAFSNYLLTSLICTAIFYGYGLGRYGYLSRAQLYLVVVAIWALMLLWSKPWLARFRYGPLEWLWRSLSRASLQPMRGAAVT